MPVQRTRRTLTAWLLAAVLLLVETGALAHELQHQLQKPDAPCAQCLFANHFGKTPVAVPHVISACAPEAYSFPVLLPAAHRREIIAYAPRAPPPHSEI